MSVPRQTFRKEERLCSRKLIEKVVEEGKHINKFPFRLTWLVAELDSKSPAQIAIVVPKRKFKRAVDRNRIKRQMREVFRKNKSQFYEALKNKNVTCALLLVYNGSEMPAFDEVEKKIILLLKNCEESI